MRASHRFHLACACLGAALALWATPPSRARAGGFDTPILYSARHMGMGGTAIGYVNDPSALYHNPAGLRGVKGLQLIGDLSLLTGKITSSPGGFYDLTEKQGYYPTRTSQLIVSPAFLLGAGYRLGKRLVFGLAAFPVASATGEYRTTGTDYSTGMARPRETINRTKLLFFEVTPGLSVELPLGFSLGAGFRATFAELERVQGWADNPRVFDFQVSGLDLTGFRLGAQWSLDPMLSVGVVYRHRIEPELEGDRGKAVDMEFDDLRTTFVLPSKLGLGVRSDLGMFGLAADLEYLFGSQNTRTTLEAKGLTTPVENVFEWRNAVTLRLGAEVRLLERFPLRAGYVYDGRVGNPHYPSAFGTPPTASHSGTLGAGYRGEHLSVNLAAALRLASTKVTPAQTDDDSNDGVSDRYACATCSKAGQDYSLWLTGAYVDVSYDFDLPSLF